ncbi:hypothetical protein [Limnobacter sp.]|uniref:hypothetical protein n=1 Tax=Limnobacter sp. TaxID=2003368 RepID=UPI002FE2D14B
MKKQISVVLLLTFPTHLLAGAGIQFLNKTTLFITNIQELSLHQQAPSSIKQLIENWSQFEILVNKKHFPIEAPNCKQTIKIRFKGIEPVKDQISQVQKSRWELLERIRNGNDGNASPIFLQIDTKPYMKKSADGKYRLDYCNVFVE